MNLTEINLKKIEKIYKNNFSLVHNDFMFFQNKFTLDIYNRYNSDLDSGNIVMYFARNLHKEILHQKANDLDYNISFESFWLNHKKINQTNCTIIDVSLATGLPRETTRRKIKNLLDKKILKIVNKKIIWEPKENLKKNYMNISNLHIANLLDHIDIIANLMNITFDKEVLKGEILNNFSFYTYHYLKTHGLYLKIWQKKFKDLELLVIAQECIMMANKQFKKNKVKFQDHFFLKRNFSLTEDTLLSATIISKVTKIPRATCIRKLATLVNFKIIKKDDFTKKYSLNLKNFFNELDTKEITKETFELCGNFYLIIIKALMRSQNGTKLKS